MRNWILPGLLALSCGILANSALAGNAADCDVLKDPEDERYAPKLYGLCIAWHNANDNAKPALADKFFDRAGFDVPGSSVPDLPSEPDFACPCWYGLSIEEVCALGAPSSVASDDYPYELGAWTRVNWNYFSETHVSNVTESFFGETFEYGAVCYNTITGPTGQEFESVHLPVEAVDAEVCLMEANVIASLYNSGSCEGIEP